MDMDETEFAAAMRKFYDNFVMAQRAIDRAIEKCRAEIARQPVENCRRTLTPVDTDTGPDFRAARWEW